jgi:hypothetical protein
MGDRDRPSVMAGKVAVEGLLGDFGGEGVVVER